MEHVEPWVTVGGGGVLLVVLGRFVVPLLKRMFDNMFSSVTASGTLLAQVQAERDQWRTRAQEIDNAAQLMRQEWVDMKAKHLLLEYQLEQAQKLVAELQQINAELRAEIAKYRGALNA